MRRNPLCLRPPGLLDGERSPVLSSAGATIHEERQVATEGIGDNHAMIVSICSAVLAGIAAWGPIHVNLTQLPHTCSD